MTSHAQTAPDAPAIERFSIFLEQRGCSFWLENKFDEVLPPRRTKPDFFVRTTTGKSVLVEIESFEKKRSVFDALRQNSVMSGLGATDNSRFLTALQHACKQLKPYRDLSFSSLVVLDDFRDVGMPVNVDILGLLLLDWFSGNPERNHVSAAAWFLGEGSDSFLRVYQNPNSTHPLVSDVFGNARDEYWSVVPGEFWKRKD